MTDTNWELIIQVLTDNIEQHKKMYAESEAKRKQGVDYRTTIERKNYELRDENSKLKSRLEIALEYPELVRQFGDIWKDTNRWNVKRYSSKSVNSIVDKVECRHNCGCCPDSPIEVWPYTEFNGVKIYSDPPSFNVGEANCHDGETPYDNWQEKLRTALIAEVVIQQIEAWFEKNKPGQEEDGGTD